jgi:hypothetical protein
MIKKIFGAAALATVLGLAGGQAHAVENLIPHLSGINAGGATGVIPPEGLYFINTATYLSGPLFDSASNKSGVNVLALVDVPEVFWSTGLDILGGHYGVAFANPWDFTGLSGAATASGASAFSAVIAPAVISWELPSDLHFAARLDIFIPEGAYRDPITHPFGNLTAIDFFSFEPSVALSWLSNGWNISGKVYADINTRDQSIDYTSGTVLGTEESITKRFDKWNLGLAGFTQTQLNKDSGSAVALVNGPLAAADGHFSNNYGAGPFVGYNFGPVDLDVFFQQTFGTTNDTGGFLLFTRLVVPLGGI